MQRITEKMLELSLMRLNAITNSPTSAYTKNEAGEFKTNPGHFHLSHAYGGVCVHRMYNEGGAVTTPILSYHTTKRDLYDRLNAFIDGIEFSQRTNSIN